MLALMVARRSWLAALRWIIAGILGYLLIALLTTLGFVTWLENADLYLGDGWLKAKALLVTVVSGLAGGMLAGALGGPRPMLHALAVLPLLCIDTAYVLFALPRTAPLWFELLGALGLMAATAAGGALVAMGLRRWGRSSARASWRTVS
jgi:hypothetical protein